MAKGTRYPEETKIEAVRRWAKGESAQDLAEEYGIHYSTLADWKTKSKHKKRKRRVTKPKPKTIINNGEVTELKKTIIELSTDLQFWKNYTLKLIREKESQ